MKSWYSMKASASGGVSISIHDEIGYWGVRAKDFIAEFNALPPDAPINLSIHSPGGDVFDAMAIYHVLARQSARITARVEGIAASAASIILMAAGRIVVPENAYVMIHNPWCGGWGEASELRDMADLLDKLTISSINIYSARTGLSGEEIRSMMDAETWMTGLEAQGKGFADEVEPAIAIAALADLTMARFANLPTALRKAPPVADEVTEPPVVADLVASADAVISACEARKETGLIAMLAKERLSPEALESRLSNAIEIRELAKAAGFAGLADELIQANASVNLARSCLQAMRVAGAPTIASSSSCPAYLLPGNGSDGIKNDIDVRNIYAKRKGD